MKPSQYNVGCRDKKNDDGNTLRWWTMIKSVKNIDVDDFCRQSLLVTDQNISTTITDI